MIWRLVFPVHHRYSAKICLSLRVYGGRSQYQKICCNRIHSWYIRVYLLPSEQNGSIDKPFVPMWAISFSAIRTPPWNLTVELPLCDYFDHSPHPRCLYAYFECAYFIGMGLILLPSSSFLLSFCFGVLCFSSLVCVFFDIIYNSEVFECIFTVWIELIWLSFGEYKHWTAADSDWVRDTK